MNALSRKKLNGLTHRVSKSLLGTTLAEAFVIITRREGLDFHLARLNGEARARNDEKNPRRINIDVNEGIVKSAWVG